MTNDRTNMIGLGEGVVGNARVTCHLDEPRKQLRIGDPRRLGRAQVRFDGKIWDAKHYWAEGSGADRVTFYEFDEAIPAGNIELIVPVE
jgi:hypothetical protein